MEEPIAIPAMAPALRGYFVWRAEGVVVFVAGMDGWGEWSMVMMLGVELKGNSACEMEKFRCSKSTRR